MKIKFKGRNIRIKSRKVSCFGKYSGLMFKSANTENLFFEFGEAQRTAIHSCFVFFKFLALWLDKRNNVVDFEIVKPFTLWVTPKKKAGKLLELPFNKKNAQIIEIFVGE